MAWVITQGEMQQAACLAEMCTYVYCHMVRFVKRASESMTKREILSAPSANLATVQ